MRSKKIVLSLLSVLSLSTFSPLVYAETGAANNPKLVIVVDNLGAHEQAGIKVAQLPGQIACSILPHQRYSAKIAEHCHAQGKTVILNTPMQAQNHYPLGKGGLTAEMSKQAFIQVLNDDMASVPYLQGLDNQMGSQLTAQAAPMDWLMAAIKPHGLFFLDNKTSPHSVAARAAQNNKVPFTSRDIFLDDVRTPQAVQKQFSEALRIARHYGVAIIVTHADAVSLEFLQKTLPQLSEQGYKLVSLPQLLALNNAPVTLKATKPLKKEQALLEQPSSPPLVPTSASVAEKNSPVTEERKASHKDLTTIDVPAIDEATPTLEVTVGKDRRVVINSLAQAKQPVKDQEPVKDKVNAEPKKNEAQPSSKVMSADNAPLIIYTASANKEPDKQASYLERTQQTVKSFFQHKKTEVPAQAVQKPVPQAQPVPKTAQAIPVIVSPKVAVHEVDAKAKQPASISAPVKAETPKVLSKTNLVVSPNNIASATETTKASHSLIQKMQDGLCKRYGFCGKEHPAAAISHAPEDSGPTFSQLQAKLPWPTAGHITTHFGAELAKSKLKYNGVLLQAPIGQPVHAIYRGHVIFANWLQGLGLLLIIDHGDGYMSLYGHNQALYKKVGDVVKADDLIAAVGNSGVPGPSGLYFEIRHNGQPINPEQWCI